LCKFFVFSVVKENLNNNENFFLLYEIFFLYLHTNKIQIMYSVSLHNILQFAIRKQYSSFKTLQSKAVFSLLPFICVHMLNQSPLRSILFQWNADDTDGYDKFNYQRSSLKSASSAFYYYY
jgi:hypothetical protein